MGLRESAPGEKKPGARLHFAYTPTEPLEQWHAYTAGPAKWYACHCKGRTKPCLAHVTGGELVCERCNAGEESAETGFLPLWRELDWRPVFVIVHSAAREAIDALRHRQRVLIGRGAHKSDGVYAITPPKVQGTISSTDPAKLREQDVTPSLLRVWKIAELTEWYNRHIGPSKEGVSHTPAPAAVLPDVPRVTLPLPAPSGVEGINDAFARIVRRAAGPNGKHKIPPPDGAPGEGV